MILLLISNLNLFVKSVANLGEDSLVWEYYVFKCRIFIYITSLRRQDGKTFSASFSVACQRERKLAGKYDWLEAIYVIQP